MIQIKKTILTLVALLAVTTGAWATDTYTITFAANGNTKTVENVTLPKTFQCNYDKANGELDLILKELYSWTGNANQTFCDGETTPQSSDENKVVAGSDNGDHYITINNVFEGTVTITGDYYVNYSLTSYSLEISIAAVPVTPVDLTRGTGDKINEWTFTMPGGNVTLEPEYYPQATVADGGVTAADADARATTDDPLVKVDATKLTGAKKLMYFVSNSGTTAPAYDAEGWTDQLPTAEGLTQQGIVYVWYYPVGIDEGVDGATATYSDGDICLQSITARIADAPTYAVEFAEGTAEPTLWKAEPATGVTKGQTVTVTYTGSKKVIGVKAEKKAKAPAGPITVTWNGADITGTGGGKSFTKDGVTITAGDIEFMDKNFLNGGTFTTTLGNFTKIEVTTDGWYASGTGWSGSTWTGNASSVSFSGEIMGYGGDNLKFVFTIEPTN